MSHCTRLGSNPFQRAQCRVCRRLISQENVKFRREAIQNGALKPAALEPYGIQLGVCRLPWTPTEFLLGAMEEVA